MSLHTVISTATKADGNGPASGQTHTGSGRFIPCRSSAAADESLGRVFALQVGHVVSHEHDIGGEWTHIAAVRRGRELLLYVNGELSVASESPEVQSFDLANHQPLTIGFGAQGSFSGAIADMRLYDGALDEMQIRQLR